MRLGDRVRSLSNRRLARLVVPTVVVLALAGGASAYLASSGSGGGSGSAPITLSNLSITGGSATQSLLPTGTPSGDVNVTLNNSNPGPVHINSLALDTTQGTSGFSANAASCALSFTTQTNGGAGWTIPANGSLSVDLTNSLTMGTSAASSCQGQSFSVYLTAT